MGTKLTEKRNVDQALEAPEVQSLIRDFAFNSGWPDIQEYERTFHTCDILAEIPGSFIAECDEDCPVNPFTRAFFDLLPDLLKDGHEGEYIAFGYGRHWWAIGKTEDQAMRSLMRNHRYQMPTLFGPISQRQLDSRRFTEYQKWKASQKQLDRPESQPKTLLT